MQRTRFLLPILIVAAFAVTACKKKAEEPPVTSSESGGSKGTATPSGKNPQVVFKTSLGNFQLELFAGKAPISVKNFLAYVDSKFYDGTIFHRVMSDFMIQGGGFTPDLQKKPTRAPIKNEADNGLSNTRGTVAMARTRMVDSATAQFFVNVKDNQRLDHAGPGPRFGYTVFGRVIKGMDVVEKIRNTQVEKRSRQFTHLPSATVVILQARRLK
jgi:peptidyl-prolyl cis-trans isomerase A (cyclophilin A)